MSELKIKDASAESPVKKTLAEIVTNNINSVVVFEKFELDFCCNGKISLSKACDEKNINVNDVIKDLVDLSKESVEERKDNWTLDSLVDFIVNTHHQFVRRMTPVISLHSDKVASVHGENHPETIRIADLFLEVREEIEGHMMKEERILFPQIKQMVLTQKENSQFFPPQFGSIQNPIKVMEFEHNNAGDALNQIRELSNNYSYPEDADNTFKTLYSEMKEFEEDLHKHFHLENNLLFPKSIKMELELLSKSK